MKLFDNIANRYDIFNRISSFGIDRHWRKVAVSSLKSQTNLKILDVASGTGDVISAIFKNNCDAEYVAGIDTSPQMLSIAEKKLNDYMVNLKQADAVDIPYIDNYFDAVTCAFGVRNFSDLTAGLKEMMRVLKPNGKLIILEFSMPKNVIIKSFYLLYLKFYIPVLGKILTGDFQAYRYLSQTIQSFPNGQNFQKILRNAGFSDVAIEPLTFGIVSVYSATKAS